METVIAVFSLAAFPACIAVAAMILKYDVDLAFHPPMFVRLKLTATRSPEPARLPMRGRRTSGSVCSPLPAAAVDRYGDSRSMIQPLPSRR